jgi:hypothetical protein
MSDPVFADARFDMGRTISRTFGVISRNPVSVFVVCLVLQLISLGLSSVLRLSLVGYDRGLQLGLNGAASALLVLVIHAMLLGSITFIAVNDFGGNKVPFGAAVAVGFRTLLPVLGINLVASVCAGLAAILLVVPGIIVLLRWLVAVPVRVVEGPGALARSAELTKGYRWSLFGLVVGYVILAGLLTYGVALLYGGFLKSAVARTNGDPTALVLNVAVSTLLSAISASGVAAIYIELRRAKEGASVDQLAAVFG